MRLKGKNAIVTGAAGGFGREIVKKFLSEGADKIALVDINLKSLKAFELELKQKGYRVFPYKADVSNENEVEKVVNSIINEFKEVNILVNNAGITQSLPIQKVSVSDWQRGMDVNLKSTFLFCKMIIDNMVEKNYGKIINIASIAGQTGRPVSVEYAASKAGIIGLTRNLAYQVASFGINVNAIAPGPIVTPMLEKSFSKEISEKLKSTIPFRRQGEEEDIANAVLFLSSDEAGWITGQVIAVNGGAFMG
jgi:3-oxoacyl-[acyl-carrier protein] reductase